jgi:hypothetical protein
LVAIDGNPLADQIGGEFRQPIGLIVRRAVFDRQIAAFNVAHFAQPFAECPQSAAGSGSPTKRNPTTGIAGRCALARTGHAAAPPRNVMNSRR